MQLRKNGSSEKKVKPPTTGPHFKERREKTPINIWKWLFLSLVSFLFATSLVVWTRFSTVREDVRQLQTPSQKGDVKIGSMTTTRAQLNETIKVMLKSYHLSDYQLYADNQQMLLEGKMDFLGKEYPLYIYFQPSKLEDGSILLTLKDFSVGTLKLPKKTVMQVLSTNKDLPDFVKIDSKEATIKIELAKIKNEMDFYVKANTIDLYNDQIIFDLYRKK